MQTFFNSATGKYHQYEEDVTVDPPTGTWSTSSGVKGTCPTTLVPYTGTWPIPPTLNQAKVAQIALLQSAFRQAEQAPISITLASGVTTSFGMTPHDWTKIVGLYSKYVVKGDPIPSNYPLPDVNMVLRTVTKTDIDNLFEAGKSQIDNAVLKLASLLESVNTATTVEAVKSINW